MLWLITAVLGVLVLYLLHVMVSKKKNYWKDRGFHYLPGFPIIGNMADVLLKRKTMGEQSVDFYKLFEGHKYGGYMQLQTPVLIIRDPELISQVLIKDFGHFHDRGFPVNEKNDPLSANLVGLTGNRWRFMRHKLTPTFTSGKLKLMFNQIIKCSDDILDHIKSKGKVETFDARALMLNFTLNVIGSVAFGLDVNTHKEGPGNQTFLEMSKRFFAPSLKQNLTFIFMTSFPKLARKLKLRMTDNQVTEFFTKLVRDTTELRNDTGLRRNDFLQILLDMKNQQQNGKHNNIHHKNQHNGVVKDKNLDCQENGKLNNCNEELEVEDKELLNQLNHVPKSFALEEPELTEKDIAARTFIFISGGSETTAAVLHFALYELASNPDIQSKLQNEIDSVLLNQEFDYKSVKEMTYLENVFNEVIRLHPPGAFLVRECTEDYTIPDTDKVIEKGARISVPVLALHKDPKYFPDPDTFNPDRFKNMHDIPKGVFLPFGGGPRICIAMRLAILEMKIFLARLISRYTVTLNDKTQVPLKMVKTSFAQHVEGGIWVNFEERQ